MGRNSKYYGICLDRVSLFLLITELWFGRLQKVEHGSIFCDCLRSWFYLLRSSAITIIADDHRSVFPYDRRQSQNILRSAIRERLRSSGNQPSEPFFGDNFPAFLLCGHSTHTVLLVANVTVFRSTKPSRIWSNFKR